MAAEDAAPIVPVDATEASSIMLHMEQGSIMRLRVRAERERIIDAFVQNIVKMERAGQTTSELVAYVNSEAPRNTYLYPALAAAAAYKENEAIAPTLSVAVADAIEAKRQYAKGMTFAKDGIESLKPKWSTKKKVAVGFGAVVVVVFMVEVWRRNYA